MTPASDPEARAVLHLLAIPGLGGTRLARLLAHHGTARATLRAVRSRRTVLPERIARGAEDPALEIAAEDQAARLALLGGRAIPAGTPDYPSRLRRLALPPAALFVRGDPAVLRPPCVAVVGTRRATRYGHDAARHLVEGLAAAGITIVSGLARGIDGAAHEAALEAGGMTVAVLGTGLGRAYPREHARLQETIARRGLVVTELPPDAGPRPHQFPVRNRIIAGLSAAVIVVEAGFRSGAQGTVNHALDLGLEVFAVPGPIGREQSRGTNALLRDGATPALCVDDVLAVLDRPAAPPPSARPSQPDSAVFRALRDEPVVLEEVASASGVDVAAAMVELLELEVAGHVRRLAGGRFARATPAGWAG